MSTFKFKEFSITQTVNAQKVGTDSMLLGASIVGEYKNILDIGTGTGILALMLAQKNPNANITGIEIEFKSTEEARNNFLKSPFHQNLKAIHSSLQAFTYEEKFDLIITNPPYFDGSYLSSDTLKNQARHTNNLSTNELYMYSEAALTQNGKLALIIPISEEENHLLMAEKVGLYPAEILRTVRDDGQYKRSIITYVKQKSVLKESTLLVKDKNNKYSEAYIELTKPFYFKSL
jgi:tRNA1Val (adenine37-N6)-methyltransferase